MQSEPCVVSNDNTIAGNASNKELAALAVVLPCLKNFGIIRSEVFVVNRPFHELDLQNSSY
jgi:hypothetical protein